MGKAAKLLGVAVLIALGEGCVPRCEATCKKLLECGEELDTQRVALAQCEDSCIREEALYEDWEDETKQDALDEERRCIGASSCEEIADGACYEHDLFPFVGYGG